MSDERSLASAATDAAFALLDELIERGVSDVVVCPGSRSQALALAAAAYARAERIRLHVRIDERVAGFTALGLARESGVPAVVIVTSGTAVANLAPAVWEGHHSAVGMILLTADRPVQLRGVGANQTTTQPGVFTGFVRAQWDAPAPEAPDNDGTASDGIRDLARLAFAAATGTIAPEASEGSVADAPGPVHLNLQLREPLSGEAPAWVAGGRAVATPQSMHEAGALPDPLRIELGPRTVVIAGADAGADAEEISNAGGFPLIAEIVSGARFGRLLVHGYRELLRDSQLGGLIERAIVVGHPTLSREVTRLLSDPQIDVVSLKPGGVALNLNGRTRAATVIELAGTPDREWLGAWMHASRQHAVDLSMPAPQLEALNSLSGKERRAAIDAELAAVRAPITREVLADAVWRATWPHDRLVFGSSRLVRVADAVLPGKKVPVHANRGLAGIDGTIATAMGIAIASQASGARGMTRVLLGDVTFLHDVGALNLPQDEPEPRIQVIVGNDGGGTIFDGLEVAKVASEQDMRRVQYTPQTVDLQKLAAAYGWEYQLVTARSALDQVLTSHVGRRQLIEVPLPRD